MAIEIIEEKVRIGSYEFTKSELVEIGNYVRLDSDGRTYVLETEGTTKIVFNGKTIDTTRASAIRRSSAVQKALTAGLLVSVNKGRVYLKDELKNAVLRYRGKK